MCHSSTWVQLLLSPVPLIGKLLEKTSPPSGFPRYPYHQLSTHHHSREKKTHEISTVGVQLTSIIVRSQVELRLVQERDNLKVRRRAEELYTRDGALRDQPCASSRLRAPRDFLAFRVANRRRSRRRCPHAPIYILKKEKEKMSAGTGGERRGKGTAGGRADAYHRSC